jgi:hypothetical protein
VLLAPSGAAVPDKFKNRREDTRSHADLLGDLQRLRGRVYLEDGAIKQQQLTSDGRHVMEIDAKSWHVMVVEPSGSISGCIRYTPYPAFVDFEALGVAKTPVARAESSRDWFYSAIAGHIKEARDTGITFAETGGWAITDELRCSSAALHLAVGSYALAEVLGSCISVATATCRHASASILRRIGGDSLRWNGMEAATYWDTRYQCEMEILVFRSAVPNPKYQKLSEELQMALCASPAYSACDVPALVPASLPVPALAVA